MAKPLTKSRFKIALECPTKLYYEARPAEYRNSMTGNAFLAALADGGHQVGALAKFLYHPDPVGAAITVESSDYEEAVADTSRRLEAPGRVVIAEAALRHEDYFVRVDLLVRDPQQQCIEVIEVKSKGVDDTDIADRFTGRDWSPYLYDVAFQAEVAAQVFPGWRIVPKLLLLDKTAACDVPGLHRYFPVVVDPDGRNARVVSPSGLRREDLGSLRILREVDVSDVVRDLRASRVPAPHSPAEHTVDLPSYMRWTSQLQRTGARHFGGVSKACKGCQYRAAQGDPLRSGVHECFEQAIRTHQLDGPAGPLDRGTPLSIDLWGGVSGQPGVAERVLGARRALLADVQEADVAPRNPSRTSGFTPLERRMAQVRSTRDPLFRLELREERLAAMDRWQWPLHMIDFETAAPPLPFFAGDRPHDTVAFQFSHHVMERDASGSVTIRHATQWLGAEPGVPPGIEFVRQLRQALMPDGRLHGTVLRFHNHESIVLRKLQPVIAAAAVADGPALLDFIDRLTGTSDGPDTASQAMVDLHRLVQEGYYSAHAGGSLSLKYMLPAVLHDAPGLRALYARAGVYGKGLPIASLNFEGEEGHVWLQEACGWNPYRTLPPVFGPELGGLDAMFMRLGGEGDEDGAIAHGGAAMTAYQYLQTPQLAARQRQGIEAALLRYCELDTLAMVMLVQGLMELRGQPLRLAGL